jgi:hypothetical protein
MRKILCFLLVWNSLVSVLVFVLSVLFLSEIKWHFTLENRVDTVAHSVSELTSGSSEMRGDIDTVETRLTTLEGRMDLVTVAARSGWAAAYALIREGIFEVGDE